MLRRVKGFLCIAAIASLALAGCRPNSSDTSSNTDTQKTTNQSQSTSLTSSQLPNDSGTTNSTTDFSNSGGNSTTTITRRSTSPIPTYPIVTRPVDLSLISGGYVAAGSSNNSADRKALATGLASVIGEKPMELWKPDVSYNSSLKNTANISQGYVLDESFMCWPIENSGLLVSGWDIDDAGGGVQDSAYSYFRLIDTSSTKSVSASRSFVKQSSGKVYIDFNIGVTKNTGMDGSAIQFKNADNTVAFEVSFNDGNLCYKTDSTTIRTLKSYRYGDNYGVRIVIDFSTKKSSVWVDGIQRAQNISFSSANIEKVKVFTSPTGTGGLYFNYISMYKGYLVNEKFVTTLSGSLPDDYVKSGNQTAAVVETTSYTPPDKYCLKLTDTSNGNFVNMYKSFDKTTKATSFSYFFFAQNSSEEGHVFRIMNGQKAAFYLKVENNIVSVITANGIESQIYEYVPGVWFQITIKADPVMDTATVLINQKIRIKDLKMNAKANSFDGISFSTLKRKQAAVYIDDITVNQILDLPSDYVPKPTVANTGKYIVGVQSCDMYRVTDHLGWDRLNGVGEVSGERKPIIGWYDDGNVEAMDWQLKYMAEHGITYWMPDWIRPFGSSGQAIKKPQHGYAMQAYFEAQYSNKVKIALMLSPDDYTLKDAEDWQNNLVPYWIEWYVKDSRYMTVDNKPIFTVYDYDVLKERFGGTAAAVKEQLDFLRNACVEAGYSGAYIILQESQNSIQRTLDIKSAGFDYINNYTWGYQYSPTFAGQASATNDVSTVDLALFIPMISAGLDTFPYDGVNQGRIMPPAEIKKMAQWVKDKYMTRFSSNSLQSKMVILDNWNEYGEGHFFNPTEGYGFAKLDAIKDVFASGTHKDVVPTKAQKDRIGTLYPQDRVISLPARYSAIPTIAQCKNVIKKWDFNTKGNTEGWTPYNSSGYCGNMTTSGGYLNIQSGGRWTMRFSLSQNANVDASKVSYIRIRLKGNLPDVAGAFHYQMNDETDINWRYNMRQILFEKTGAGYTDIIVDVARGNNWNGTFNKAQVWLYTLGNEISIDFIEMIGK